MPREANSDIGSPERASGAPSKGGRVNKIIVVAIIRPVDVICGGANHVLDVSIPHMLNIEVCAHAAEDDAPDSRAKDLLRSLHADAKLEAWAKKLQSQADTFIV